MRRARRRSPMDACFEPLRCRQRTQWIGDCMFRDVDQHAELRCRMRAGQVHRWCAVRASSACFGVSRLDAPRWMRCHPRGASHPNRPRALRHLRDAAGSGVCSSSISGAGMPESLGLDGVRPPRGHQRGTARCVPQVHVASVPAQQPCDLTVGLRRGSVQKALTQCSPAAHGGFIGDWRAWPQRNEARIPTLLHARPRGASRPTPRCSGRHGARRFA